MKSHSTNKSKSKLAKLVRWVQMRIQIRIWIMGKASAMTASQLCLSANQLKPSQSQTNHSQAKLYHLPSLFLCLSLYLRWPMTNLPKPNSSLN
ncbi:hypothetical protein [Moraxella lacunata]|uniref:hypothetical protein n=1 Tax=Moraxella lacunata TaxID=477 RepID=UPI003EE04679